MVEFEKGFAMRQSKDLAKGLGIFLGQRTKELNT